MVGRIDAIPCTITCGRKEARIEATLPCDLLRISLTQTFAQGETQPISMPVNIKAWAGHRVLDLPLFDSMTSTFGHRNKCDRFSLECFVPGQRLMSGSLDFKDDEPYLGIATAIDFLRKARAVAVVRLINPVLPEDFVAAIRLAEIDRLHQVLLGDGYKQQTPKAQVRLTVERSGIRKFLNEVKDASALGTLNLFREETFEFLGETITIDPLERAVTNVRLVNGFAALREELRRSPRKAEFRLVWKATETTETILRSKRAEGEQSDASVGLDRAGDSPSQPVR